MKRTMMIEGMMCPHCEGRVKATLEGLSAVAAAEVSHERNMAVVTLSAEISNEELKKVIEAQGYTVTEIR